MLVVTACCTDVNMFPLVLLSWKLSGEISPLGLAGLKISEVNEVRSEPVDDGTEGKTVPPGRGEVGDVDPGVAGGDLATPLVQGGHSGLQHPLCLRSDVSGLMSQV